MSAPLPNPAPPTPAPAPADGPVDRCVCVNVTFEHLRRSVETSGGGLPELIARTACCTGCGTCEPYIRLMITTGRTRFAVLSAAEARRVITAGTGGPPVPLAPRHAQPK